MKPHTRDPVFVFLGGNGKAPSLQLAHGEDGDLERVQREWEATT